MSHHFDSPTAIEDGRINLCAVYAFNDGADRPGVVLTVNPDAARSTPSTLRPDPLCKLVVASDAGGVEDRAWRVTVSERAMACDLRDAPDPARHAPTVAEGFLPDVLHYRPGRPARFHPGAGNGRALHNDAFGTALSLFNGAPLGVSPSPPPAVAAFPHLAPPGHRDLPALAEPFGLREDAPEKGLR